MDDPTGFIRQAMPFAATLGITGEEVGPAAVHLTLHWSEGSCTAGGALHGGVIMSLADSAGATLAYLNLPEGATGTSTIESKTNFVGSVTSGRVRAVSRALHIGRSTIVVETEVRDAGDRLVAKTTQTQAVLWPRNSTAADSL